MSPAYEAACAELSRRILAMIPDHPEMALGRMVPVEHAEGVAEI